MDAIAKRYAEDFNDFLVDCVFLRRGVPGTELSALIEDLRPGFADGSFLREDSEDDEAEEASAEAEGEHEDGGDIVEWDDGENFVYIWR